MIGTMRIGIGLPAAVPEADMAQIGSFAAQAEQAGFESVGVIDRLVYDNIDPLVALAAAAACTSRIRLISTVVNVNWRANPRLLAKQISSVVRVSGGRGIAAARDAWARCGRAGLPRVITARYFSLGPQADRVADEYLAHYYGREYFTPARSDTLTSAEGVRAELARLAGAGCTDVVLYPCSGDLDQVERLSQALSHTAVPVPETS
jgi:alkanesulfonate monooxygenase SsuD/methylene tetrahydromethanopterin reductase-like flavin-dependent oxidoreductase (luciferase family)